MLWNPLLRSLCLLLGPLQQSKLETMLSFILPEVLFGDEFVTILQKTRIYAVRCCGTSGSTLPTLYSVHLALWDVVKVVFKLACVCHLRATLQSCAPCFVLRVSSSVYCSVFYERKKLMNFDNLLLKSYFFIRFIKLLTLLKWNTIYRKTVRW